MFDTLTKESDLHQIHHDDFLTDNNETSHKEKPTSIKKTELHPKKPEQQLASLAASIKEHKLFKAQKDKHNRSDSTSQSPNTHEENIVQQRSRSNAVFEPVQQRGRSNAVFEPVPQQRARSNAMSVQMDGSTKSLFKIRGIVLAAKHAGSFDKLLTFEKKEGFLSKFKKDKMGTIKETAKEKASSIGSSLKKDMKERATSKFGETVESTAEKLGSINSYREKMQDALKNKDIETVKSLIAGRIGENKPLNFIMKAVEWICRTFGGQKGDGISKGVDILDKIGLYGGPIGTAIKTVQSGYETVKKVYKLFKERNEKTKSEVVHDVGDIVTQSLESAAGIVESVKSTLEKLDVFKSVFTSVLPIVGSAISIGINGASIIVKVYDAIKAFIYKAKSSSLAESFAGKANLSKFIVEKSKFFRKYNSVDKKAAQSRKDELTLKQKNEGLNEQEAAEYEDLQSFLLYKHLKSHNKKRGIRSVIIIGEKLVSIGAEIASIIGVATQGAGTAVGTAMKAAVTVEKIGRKAYNVTKQLGRDYAPEKWGIFDKDKSTDQKMKAYYENAYTILDRIGQLPIYEPNNEEVKSQYEQRQVDLKLANSSVYSLSKHDRLEDIRDFLIKGMKQRE